MKEIIPLVFDTKLKRPACVLIQAIGGGDRWALLDLFPDNWLVHPTPDMKVIHGTREQWEGLAEKLKKG